MVKWLERSLVEQEDLGSIPALSICFCYHGWKKKNETAKLKFLGASALMEK